MECVIDCLRAVHSYIACDSAWEATKISDQILLRLHNVLRLCDLDDKYLVCPSYLVAIYSNLPNLLLRIRLLFDHLDHY